MTAFRSRTRARACALCAKHTHWCMAANLTRANALKHYLVARRCRVQRWCSSKQLPKRDKDIDSSLPSVFRTHGDCCKLSELLVRDDANVPVQPFRMVDDAEDKLERMLQTWGEYRQQDGKRFEAMAGVSSFLWKHAGLCASCLSFFCRAVDVSSAMMRRPRISAQYTIRDTIGC